MSLTAAEANEPTLREAAPTPNPAAPTTSSASQDDQSSPVAKPIDGFVPTALLVEPPPSRYIPTGPALRLLPMPRQAESLTTRLSWTGIAIGIACLYLYALLAYWSPAHPGVDQNGYLVGGRQFAHTLSTGIRLDTPYDFIGRMWVTAPSGENYPKYPLGLPILYACCIWLQSLFGWNGYEVAHLVSPVSAMLATLGMFAIVRRLTDSGFAGVMAMILLGTGQVFMTLADNPNSHAAGTCTIVWGFYFLIRFLESGSLWRGITAGFLFGFAYMIRYTDGMLVALLGVAMLYMAKWRWPTWRFLGIGSGAILLFAIVTFIVSKFWGAALAARWTMLLPLRPAEGFNRPALYLFTTIAIAAFVSLFMQGRSWWRLFVVGCGWLVPVVYLTLFNMYAMQSFTSYAGTNESTGFDGDNFVRNWELMVRTLHDQALFFIAPLGLLGLVAMVRRMPMIAALLALWFFPSVLLYTAYYWAPDNWGVSYSRFILTAVPALTISAAWVMAEVMRRQGRTAWRISPVAKTIVASLGLVIGAGMLVLAFVTRASIESWTWSVVAVGAMLALAGGTTLVAMFITRDNNALASQYRGWVPRLAFGVVVLCASSVALVRTMMGSEWGRLGNPRASIETQARQNANLWGLGKQVRAAVPDGSILFADGERMHHFQFLGGWHMFDTAYFDVERMKRETGRTIGEDNPDPIDPSRIKFLKTVYDNKDQAAVRGAMNDIIADALAKKTRVFYAMTNASGENFRRTLDRRRFEVKTVGSYNDVPPPRDEDDLLPPSQRQPVINRFGGGARQRQANNFFAASEKQAWRVVEVVPIKPPEPKAATQPTTAPAPATTAPTTKP